jgi:hypothetical protein
MSRGQSVGSLWPHSRFLDRSRYLFFQVAPTLWSEFLTTDPGVPDSIPGHYKKKVVGLERGPFSLVSTTEELLDRNVATPV